MVYRSVEKTGRLIIITEDTEVVCFAEHILRKVLDNCFYSLKTQPKIITAHNLPCGLATPLEEEIIPSVQRVRTEVLEYLGEEF